MKKIISTLFGLSLFCTAAVAENNNMIGVKYGVAGLQGTQAEYTAGSVKRGANTDHIESEYGAIFAEYALGSSPISIGLSYVPFDGVISVDTGSSVDSSATLKDYTTLYALAGHSFSNDVGIYASLGYSYADLAVAANSDDTTINSHDNSLEGITLGLGIQSPEFGAGLISRFEISYTSYDDLNVTTTSNGSASVAKKGTNIESATASISVAKTF